MPYSSLNSLQQQLVYNTLRIFLNLGIERSNALHVQPPIGFGLQTGAIRERLERNVARALDFYETRLGSGSEGFVRRLQESGCLDSPIADLVAGRSIPAQQSLAPESVRLDPDYLREADQLIGALLLGVEPGMASSLLGCLMPLREVTVPGEDITERILDLSTLSVLAARFSAPAVFYTFARELVRDISAQVEGRGIIFNYTDEEKRDVSLYRKRPYHGSKVSYGRGAFAMLDRKLLEEVEGNPWSNSVFYLGTNIVDTPPWSWKVSAQYGATEAITPPNFSDVVAEGLRYLLFHSDRDKVFVRANGPNQGFVFHSYPDRRLIVHQSVSTGPKGPEISWKTHSELPDYLLPEVDLIEVYPVDAAPHYVRVVDGHLEPIGLEDISDWHWQLQARLYTMLHSLGMVTNTASDPRVGKTVSDRLVAHDVELGPIDLTLSLKLRRKDIHAPNLNARKNVEAHLTITEGGEARLSEDFFHQLAAGSFREDLLPIAQWTVQGGAVNLGLRGKLQPRRSWEREQGEFFPWEEDDDEYGYFV